MILHIFTSELFPKFAIHSELQSNGQLERFVDNFKRVLLKARGGGKMRKSYGYVSPCTITLDLGEMAMNVYITFPIYPALEPHHQR